MVLTVILGLVLADVTWDWEMIIPAIGLTRVYWWVFRSLANKKDPM